MLDLELTRHGEARMRQRGYRDADVALVLNAATRVADDAYLLTNQDAAREIARRKREIQQLERLRGSKIIVEGTTLITLYHATAAQKGQNRRKRRGQR